MDWKMTPLDLAWSAVTFLGVALGYGMFAGVVPSFSGTGLDVFLVTLPMTVFQGVYLRGTYWPKLSIALSFAEVIVCVTSSFSIAGGVLVSLVITAIGAGVSYGLLRLVLGQEWMDLKPLFKAWIVSHFVAIGLSWLEFYSRRLMSQELMRSLPNTLWVLSFLAGTSVAVASSRIAWKYRRKRRQ